MNHAVNILLVDDEARNLDALESFLQSPDYNLVRALSGQAALMLLLEGEFAAIVLDIQMPGMTGIELANLIKQRKRTQHIPIIFLTAYFQEDKDVLEGYGLGAVDYLTKPINPQILKSKISVFVDLFCKTRALAATNAALELEVSQRQKAEEALRLANNALEARVQERTTDLSRVNEELRQRETALRQSEAQAMAASRAKDDFLAALSHELRTPLNPVLLLATEAANNPKIPAEVRADFETIAMNVALEAPLIDDMLDLTRIARGKVALEMKALNVHTLLQDALAMARAEIDLKQIALTLRLDASRHLVLGDDVRLKQIFWNVIKNAGKFTPEHGRILIETDAPAQGGDLIIRIIDNGIGMTSTELGRIFEAFSQGDHATQGGPHRFGGMGLGLAISRMMAKLHSGSITATSAGRNQGTTVLIKLPLLAESPPGAPPQMILPQPAPLPASPVINGDHPCRILLVEDHLPTARTLKHLLIRRNYQVAAADCVKDALALANRENFDLLISDIGLPDGTGYELMAELRTSHSLVGIALTGYGMEEDVNRSHAAGFVAHLTKPVSVHALDTALSAIRREPDNKKHVAGDGNVFL